MTFLYAVPLGRVLVQSFTDPVPGIGNFTAAFQDPVMLKVLWITTRISIEVAVVTLLLGFPVAVYMSGLPPRKARIVALFVIIPFWTSVLVRSFAWIVLLGDNGLVAKLLSPFTGNTTGLLYSEGAVVVAMVHVLLPFLVLTVKGTLDQIDPTLLRAARTLGAGPVRAFVRVYLPLALPGMASGTLLVFIMALGYYITPALVGGPGETTFAMLIEQKVNTTFEWGMAASMATILLVLSVGLYLLVRRFTRVEGLVGRV
ncbi:ABC transporter permease [Asanoa sp. WMMD1127]|uniref:ABC transporter permease n=1 Tax=Asanoa sp. WMMD1127 TaxID=3016107 RepID=UPI002415DAA3|nr:ABC transporter permease [Asanoa sp. WMMD1127]MDG4825281.1 ABC transporter permease [Asanoa sp. WMMD1127]